MAAQLGKEKASLTTQLEDSKRLAEAETRVSVGRHLEVMRVINCVVMMQDRINLLGKMRNLEHELELMKEHLEEEYEAKQDIERQLSKVIN